MAKSFIKRRRNDLLYYLIRSLFFLAGILPRKVGLFLFGWLGGVVFKLPTIERKRTFNNLRFIFSATWTEEKIAKVAKATYINIGKNLFDAIYLSKCSTKKFYSIFSHDDLGPFEKASENKTGLIAVTGHIGCFEMTSHCLAHSEIKCFSVGQKLYDERVDKIIVSLRQNKNIAYLHRDGSSREILRYLKKGRVFGVLLDQDINIESVFANFLGIPAYTPSGPIRMAMRFKIPVVVSYAIRNEDDTHHLFVSEPVEMEDTGDFERDLVMNIEKVNYLFSKGVFRYPEQWVWMHRRWKRKPENKKYKDIPNINNYR